MDPVSKNLLLLSGCRIVTPDQVIEQGAILIAEGLIARIFQSSDNAPKADSEVDLHGTTLFPGFIDIHIHGAVGVDTMEAGGKDLNRVADFLAQNGVTAWLPTLVPGRLEQYQDAVAAIENVIHEQRSPANTNTRAQVLGTHYEGPFVNARQCGALHLEYFRTFSNTGDLDDLPTIKNEHAVHMMTLAPEVEGGVALIAELRKRAWVVSIGHTRASAEVLDRALRAGAHHMTHFMNAMTALHHRAPGAVGWGLMRDEVTCDLIADGVHIDPSILKLILRVKNADRISLISDAIAAAGLDDGEYQIWGETIVVKNGRTQNARGSIAGSVITMLEAVRMMLSLGVSEVDVAGMAALNPARLLQIDQEYGSIEEGKRADLVALDPDRTVRLTIVNGRVAYQSS